VLSLSIRCAFLSSVTLSLLACSGSDGGIDDRGQGGNGSTANGGAASGQGGSVVTPGSGGSSSSGTGSGGVAAQLGGQSSLGGSAPESGGTTAQGGFTTQSGGASPSGGALAAGGGANLSGGASPTGGATAKGGASAMGGALSTGGGAGKGGAAATGGGTSAPGLGAWTTGYVATMFGDSSSGDCAGYASFNDATPIKTFTCQGAVTIANFSAGAANNASYYGATGDLSSLWVGAQCMCQGGGTGNCAANAAPSCPAEKLAAGNCGKCVAVKCDPNGTFADGGSTHTRDCSTTTFVVVQITDACPHNHATNVASSVGWCTSRQANHIDLSCSGLGDISTKGTAVGQDGWLNVDVQMVDCSIGLGKHSL
jgi:hypothetical protein